MTASWTPSDGGNGGRVGIAVTRPDCTIDRAEPQLRVRKRDDQWLPVADVGDGHAENLLGRTTAIGNPALGLVKSSRALVLRNNPQNGLLVAHRHQCFSHPAQEDAPDAASPVV